MLGNVNLKQFFILIIILKLNNVIQYNSSLKKSKRFDGDEGKTFLEYFDESKKEMKEELATILKTTSAQSPTKTSKEIKSKKILEQKLSKNLFITWSEDEDDDEPPVVPSKAKASKEENQEEDMLSENEDEQKKSPSGSSRRRRYV